MSAFQNVCLVDVQTIFTNFEYSEEKTLETTALRTAMAMTFEDKHRFQIGMMDDAAECYVCID